jgi:hypothetical protein
LDTDITKRECHVKIKAETREGCKKQPKARREAEERLFHTTLNRSQYANTLTLGMEI